jgi:hypothetical protein
LSSTIFRTNSVIHPSAYQPINIWVESHMQWDLFVNFYYLFVVNDSLESREYGRRDPPCLPRGTFYPQKFALTSPTNCGRSVGIGCSRTQAKEYYLMLM